jgi:hypothetical protein
MVKFVQEGALEVQPVKEQIFSSLYAWLDPDTGKWIADSSSYSYMVEAIRAAREVWELTNYPVRVYKVTLEAGKSKSEAQWEVLWTFEPVKKEPA